MGRTIKIGINMDKIPAANIRKFTRKDGTIGVTANIVVQSLKQKDPYGNDYTIYLEQTKEEREMKSPKIYVGKGITLYEDGKFVGNASAAAAYCSNNQEDLPF